MRSKTLISLLFILTILASLLLLPACGGGERIEKLDTPVVLSDAGGAYYEIVTPARATNTVLDCVARMGALAVGEGIPSIPVQNDGESAGEGRLEILVGKTDRAETRAVMDELAYGDWAVVLRGEKIVVAAHTKESLRAAATVLFEELLRVEEDENEAFGAVFVLLHP